MSHQGWRESGNASRSPINTLLKGLILAQNERWRRGLGMQVVGMPARVEPA
jgi:hypothetical protein